LGTVVLRRFGGPKVQSLPQDNLASFVTTIAEGRTLFVLEEAGEHLHLTRTDRWDADKHTLGSYRPVEPLKALLFPPRELVGSFGTQSGETTLKERLVVGVKSCDLSALKVLDHVFLETEPLDPFYARAREKTIIVSCDCTDMREVCFCAAVEKQPYPDSGFDINLSPTPLGIVVEAGSKRGEALLRKAGKLLQPAEKEILDAREKQRTELTERIAAEAAARGLVPGADLRGAIERSAGNEAWKELTRDCVECGACNFVCCTCHCFLLADGKNAEGASARVKKWDSCLYEGFARVAGGANPRERRAERLYNRFDKKFSFFPNAIGGYACFGCGRCIEACAGKVDIRDVLKRLQDG